MRHRIVFVLLLALTVVVGMRCCYRHASLASNQSTTSIADSLCITRTGKVYHRCYHYRGRNYPITMKEIKEKSMRPCRVCKPPALE